MLSAKNIISYKAPANHLSERVILITGAGDGIGKAAALACANAGATVMAIGDGLNDAPLLRAADVSVAVAGATALAQAQADFVITEESIDRLFMIRKAAFATRRITRQNLAWAAGYNLVGLPLAALGCVPPWAAALGMSASSLLVVLNSLRLRRLKD